MQFTRHVQELLHKYAHIIGGVDANGKFYNDRTETQLKQHIFWVEPRDEDSECAGDFVLGNIVSAFIKDGDDYVIDYVGLHKDAACKATDESTKEAKATRLKYEKYVKKQAKRIAEAVERQQQEQGIYAGTVDSNN